ncbi:endothelial lipase isoform X2 [Piliocolobus tephrosceles]|uniref:phospholipase A1 n=1 Tax=Piliocolobus tephrosceles TaxID=591936 RepID=A0A8C9LPH0_9PRIM|nr:endothelial lipase isoform X2 [Piliocolobus tephrosceles]
MSNSVPLLCFWSLCCCFAAGSPTPFGPEGLLEDELHKPKAIQTEVKPSVRFNLRTSKDPEHEGCYLSLGHSQPLEDCGFNMTAKTFFIIHGWTMSGIFENWLHKLVSALHTREKDANVVVVDWLPLAHQLYTDAVNNTRVVGHSIARMLDWLQEKDDFSLGNVHLIGYSLGAHVAGYAGNFVKGTVGRITAITEVVKCEHERAVHLFVDSLVNQDKPSFAFQCTDSNRFKKGICLSCRKNRCNSIGYNAKKMRNKRNSKMYLKTRAGMPFKVYHYQMKIHVFSYKNMGEIEPTFYVTLYGTNADSQTLPLEIVERIEQNATNTFLVYTEEDLGDLLKIQLTWEGASQSWYNLWKELRSYLSQPRNPGRELNIRRIRVKSGETQRKLTFCAEDPENTSISPGRELWFSKCRDGWRMKNETSPTVELP